MARQQRNARKTTRRGMGRLARAIHDGGVAGSAAAAGAMIMKGMKQLKEAKEKGII